MNGHINEDLFIYDIKRFQNFHSEINLLKKESQKLLRFIWNALAIQTT